MRYFLSLGSNVGQRRRNLARAVEALELAGVAVLRTSSLYRTEPVDGGGPEWFYNLAAEVSVPIGPEEMLDLVKGIERRLGRRTEKSGRLRSIDIDVLLAENQVIRSKRLTVPHPRLAQRNFVLVPLAEISPETVHPVLKKKIKELRAMSRDRSVVMKLSSPLRHASVARRTAGAKVHDKNRVGRKITRVEER
ncbi:MAG: 2-amino-4-hydroxy-6-hydroxymethyldihydropteridine diphosphokinase [Candidatus Aminicenantes bacterium]|nr:2-amino-4-hydroxy-6-hydroxymethyldihydropteridine diphosphokinase [Candidatus Aminicenantes bacterium]